VFVRKDHGINDLLDILTPSLQDALLALINVLPDSIRITLTTTTLNFEPMIFHAAVFGIFASVIAPFAGFFASGFKRAFRVKDFAVMIPGHGGMTDRMDCQVTSVPLDSSEG